MRSQTKELCLGSRVSPNGPIFWGGGDFISQQAPQEVLKIKLAPTLLPYSKPNIRPTLKSRVRVNFVFFIF